MSLNDLSDEADSPGGVHSDIDNVAFPALNGTGYDDTRSFSNFQSDDSRGEPNCPTTSKYRRIEEGLLSDSDKEKLNQRRERNKAAAARCRNRRRETICRLEKEACDWEEKVKELKLDIEKLTKQRDQLEFLLQVHTATCSMINRPIPSQRLEDLLPEESISTAATSISASSTTVTAPVFVPPPPTSNQVQLTSTSASQSALPPLSEVVKTDVLSNIEDLPSAGRLEHVLPTAFSAEGSLKLLVLGGKLSETSSHTTPSISAMSLATSKRLTLNLHESCSSSGSGQGSSTSQKDETDPTNRKSQSNDEVNYAGGNSSLSSEESLGKSSKNFTLPLITTPVTPPSEMSEINAETPVLSMASFLNDVTSKFTPSTPLLGVSTNGNNILTGCTVGGQFKGSAASFAWTPIFTSAMGITPSTNGAGLDSIFTPVIEIKSEPCSPPLSSTTETNSTSDSVD